MLGTVADPGDKDRGPVHIDAAPIRAPHDEMISDPERCIGKAPDPRQADAAAVGWAHELDVIHLSVGRTWWGWFNGLDVQG